MEREVIKATVPLNSLKTTRMIRSNNRSKHLMGTFAEETNRSGLGLLVGVGVLDLVVALVVALTEADVDIEAVGDGESGKVAHRPRIDVEGKGVVPSPLGEFSRVIVPDMHVTNKQQCYWKSIE